MARIADHTPPGPEAGHARALLVLGLPLIGSHLGQIAIHTTDTVMLGWYGVTELAALVLAVPLYFVLFVVGSGFAWAVMPMVASYAGSGEGTQVRRVTRMGLWLSILFGAAVTPVLVWSEPLLRLMGQDPEVSRLAAVYLRIAAIGFIPSLLVMVLKSYLAALERTQAVFWITVATAVLNGLLNYALIFGNWGFPELGVAGAAVASVTLQIVSLAALAVYVARVTPEFALFIRFWRPDWEAFRAVFRLGWPIGMTSLAETGLFAGSSLLVGWIGTVELAAHGIAMNVASITFMVHIGLSQAATIRVGQFHGRQDPRALRGAAFAAYGLSGLMVAATIAAFLTLGAPIVGLFLDPSDPARPEIIAVGVTLLAMAALFQLMDAGQVMSLGVLRGIQDTRVPMIHAAISYWGVGMPAAYVLGFPLGFGVVGVWTGLVIGLAFAAGLLFRRFWTLAGRTPAPA
ncbi:MATE family efflux transporter [Palleronia sp. KMU-117]|uniref:MATE family efflux transporter n=1 Tax=Palleronia sp. KMU-117 TaxID=3434108 RepID=UPI003D76666B